MTPVPRRWPGATAVIVGTGPSLTPSDLELCRQAREAGRVRLFAANRAAELVPADVIHGCNFQFWEHYWPALAHLPAEKWTTRPELDGRFPGLHYIPERWEPGLSRDPTWIAAHHGTGPQLVNLAYLYGCTRLLLLGWDMRFHGKRGPREYDRRRYLGEDPLTLQHWPRTGPAGELEGLIREMETIRPAEYGIEIINVTPGSALRCFPFEDFANAIAAP